MKIIKISILFTLIFSFLLFSRPLLAASLQFSNQNNEIRVGDVFVVDVKLLSENEKINVADIVLYYDQSVLEVLDISTGNSIFNLWTRNPIFSNETGKIIFTGGVAGGISTDLGQIIRIVFSAKKSGTGSLVFSSESALYLNNSKGTLAQLNYEDLNITILEKNIQGELNNEWYKLLNADKTPPSKINVTLGRDESVFDNKYFISFTGEDHESGVKLYEIKEGHTGFVVSESPYVLRDQSLNSSLWIKVSDHAGNYKIVEFDPKEIGKAVSRNRYFVSIVIILAIIMGLYIKKRNNEKNK
jgi:hypothetical protein